MRFVIDSVGNFYSDPTHVGFIYDLRGDSPNALEGCVKKLEDTFKQSDCCSMVEFVPGIPKRIGNKVVCSCLVVLALDDALDTHEILSNFRELHADMLFDIELYDRNDTSSYRGIAMSLAASSATSKAKVFGEAVKSDCNPVLVQATVLEETSEKCNMDRDSFLGGVWKFPKLHWCVKMRTEWEL